MPSCVVLLFFCFVGPKLETRQPSQTALTGFGNTAGMVSLIPSSVWKQRWHIWAVSKHVNYGEVLHYSLWARPCSLARGTVITLPSLQTGAAGRASFPSPCVPLCLRGEALAFSGLHLTAKDTDTLGKALEIIRKRNSACQILVSILEAKLIFFFFFVLNDSSTTQAQTVFANHGEKKI